MARNSGTKFEYSSGVLPRRETLRNAQFDRFFGEGA